MWGSQDKIYLLKDKIKFFDDIKTPMPLLATNYYDKITKGRLLPNVANDSCHDESLMCRYKNKLVDPHTCAVGVSSLS